MTIKYRTVAKELSTSTSDVYAVPSSFKSTVDSIIIANKSTGYVDVSIDWYSALNATDYALAGSIRLEPNSTVQITDPLFLEAGDKIKGSATVVSSVVVSVRVSEEYSTATR